MCRFLVVHDLNGKSMADVKMDLPVFVRSLKSSILSSTSFSWMIPSGEG